MSEQSARPAWSRLFPTLVILALAAGSSSCEAHRLSQIADDTHASMDTAAREAVAVVWHSCKVDGVPDHSITISCDFQSSAGTTKAFEDGLFRMLADRSSKTFYALRRHDELEWIDVSLYVAADDRRFVNRYYKSDKYHFRSYTISKDKFTSVAGWSQWPLSDETLSHLRAQDSIHSGDASGLVFQPRKSFLDSLAEQIVGN